MEPTDAKATAGDGAQFVVTMNNPFYPRVGYRGTLDDAVALRDKWLREIHEADGVHRCRISIAQVIETREFSSHY